MSRPSFQFYHGDWISNAKLRRCTHEEKGVWIDILCLLADGDEFGIIRWPLKELAQAVGARIAVLRSLLAKGVLKGADTDEQCQEFVYIPRHGRKDGPAVTLIKAQAGPIWYSSKQVRDDYVARIKAANARGGGAPSIPPSPAPLLSKGEYGHQDLVLQKSLPPSPSPSPSPLKQGKEAIPPVDNLTRAGAIAVLLRRLGVDANSTHPTVQAWAVEPRVTDQLLTESVERARLRKPSGTIAVGYLDPIVREALNPPAAKTPTDAWWASDAGVDRKGRELGMMARGNESYADFKARIFERLKQGQAA